MPPTARGGPAGDERGVGEPVVGEPVVAGAPGGVAGGLTGLSGDVADDGLPGLRPLGQVLAGAGDVAAIEAEPASARGDHTGGFGGDRAVLIPLRPQLGRDDER